MGISGLLPALKSVTETKDISAYRGQTLAIDGYCWLHRAIYSCSQEICLGQETDKYIVYFIERVKALLHHGITPYVVFDGGPLPMKKGTEEERRKSRAKNRELGVQCYRQKNYSEARKYFVRAADVSPYMAHRVIQRLKAMNVQYVVAPYEADAQLTFLMKHGMVDGVITEDSDCIPFGCTKVLFKMDRDGVAQEIQACNLKHNKGMLLHMFSEDMLLQMCILSGCDYLPSLPGFGLKKAYGLVKQHGSYSKIIRALRLEGKVRIPATYEGDFERAVLTFRHQRVFDPVSKKLVPLTPIPPDAVERDPIMDFLGPIMDDGMAEEIASGDVDPISMNRFTQSPEKLTQTKPMTSEVRFHSRVQESHPTRRAVINAQTPARALPFWASRRSPQKPSTTSRSLAASSTPKTISHFFAAHKSKLSPVDDSSKNIISSQGELSQSTYESQDPQDVNIARNLSFSPLSDDVKHAPALGVKEDKENTTPNAQHKPSEGLDTNNAFARMMKAGSLLQRQSIKRKGAVTSGHGRNKFGAMYRQNESVAERIKRHTFTGSLKEQVEEISDSTPKQTTMYAEVTPPEPDAEPGIVGDSQDEDIAPFRSAGPIANTSGNPTPMDAFAKFRFQQ